MKYLQNTPHLDPLPSSDEGRGNPAVSAKRTPICVRERRVRFPLPFRRGEDQGEGLLQKTFSSLTKWKCTPPLSPLRGEGASNAAARHSVWLRLRRAVLHRRLLIGRGSEPNQAAVIRWSASRLETCDTADWKSALRC